MLKVMWLAIVVVVGACSASTPPGNTDNNCTIPCSGSCCGTGQVCLNGSCCDNPCSAMCCNKGAVCVQDKAGNKVCAVACKHSADCTDPNTPCCGVLDDKGTVLACIPNDTGNWCTCKSGTDCASGCCGTFVDKNHNPVGPYVCTANDGAEYNCCNDGQECASGYCCVNIRGVSRLCELPCQNDTMCGAARCGLLSTGTCLGSPGACQPR